MSGQADWAGEETTKKKKKLFGVAPKNFGPGSLKAEIFQLAGAAIWRKGAPAQCDQLL